MTISYPLTPPTTPGFGGVKVKPRSVVGIARSPFTLESQAQVQQGQIWQMELQLPRMERAAAEAWIAFLLSLNGMEGTFLLGIAGCGTARGALGGTPLVNGASQTGRTLAIDGCTAGVTNWMRAGDLFQLGTGLNTHLHKNLVDANTNGSGQVTLDIWPRLRASPADNDAVVVASAKGLWRLATNEMPYDLAPPLQYTMSFPIIEAI